MITNRTFSINLFTPIWMGLAVWCAATDRVSWWTVGLIFLSGVKVAFKWKG